MKKIIWYFLIISISIYAQTIDEAKKFFDDNQKHKEAIKIFLKYPNDGEAQYYLGKAYYYGMGVEKDTKKAFEYAKKSANQNNPSGLNLLGVMYQYDEGVKKDELQAFTYYKQAANLGNTKAMMNIAKMYAVGDYVKQDANQAIYWVKKAIENGNVRAIKVIGNLYASTQVKNYEEAIKNYNNYLNHKEADPIEIPYVYLRLGDVYEDLGDSKKSFYYYKKSAQLDNIDAIMEIIYFKNPYDFMSEEEHLMWMKKGVEHKDKLAYDPLYMYYLDKNDYINLKSFLEKAYYEDQQLRMGCNLSSYYLNLSQDHFNDMDFEKAYDIANKIVSEYPKDDGIYNCYSNLSHMYNTGYYVTQDFEKAINFKKKSFEISKDFAKDEIAQSIAELYLKNLQDYDNAQKWYQIAYNLTKDEKYLSIADEYKKSLPVYEPLPKKALQEIFPILNSFTKPKQVITYLETEKYFFLSTDDKSIKIYDKESLQLVKELRAWIDYGIAGIFTSMAYDETNQLLYASTMDSDKDISKNDTIKVFDIHSGKVVKTINNKKAMKNTYLTISDDSKYLAAINNELLLNIIDTKTNEIQHYNLSSQGKFSKAEIEKKDNDYLIYLLSMNNQLYTFSLNEKRRIKKEEYIGQVAFRAFNFKHAEKIFANVEPFDLKNVSLIDKTINIEKLDDSFYSFDTKNFILNQGKISEVQPSQTNKIKIVSKYDNRLLEVYDENDKLLSEISLLYVNALRYQVLNEKYILVVTSDVTNMLIFTLDGRPVANLQGFKALQTNISYKDGLLTTFGADNVIHVFDLKDLDKYSKKEKKYNQEAMQNFLKLIGLPADFLEKIDDNFISYIVQTKQFNFGFIPTVKQVKDYFDLFMLKKEEIKPLVSLYIKNEKDWILYTPEGLFTYEGDGYKLLKYHQNQGLYKEAKIIENEKLFDKFYRPDLIKKILAGEKVDVPMDVKSVILNIKPPELQILSNQMINEKEIDLVYQVCDAGNGVADPKLLINGQAINPPSSRDFSIQKIDLAKDKCKIYKSNHTLDPGTNKISFKAYDQEKNIANESESIVIEANYSLAKKDILDLISNNNIDKTSMMNSELYLVAIAVSDYENESLDLKYSVKDALAIKDKFIKKNKNRFKQVHTFDLYDTNVTQENIDNVFNDIAKKIKHNDSFVLYIAGHGTSKDGRYQFIPYKITEKISIDSLKDNLSKVVVNKSLVLLDTCQSGSAIEKIDDIATKNRLAYDSAKINYIVASSKDQVALEGLENHGVFTYAILEGFEKAYFADESDLLVHNLGRYIQNTVPQLTKQHFHFEQEAQFKMANDFILGGKN
jgi:TPR repeat protein